MEDLGEKIISAALGMVIGGGILIFTAYNFRDPIIKTYQDYRKGFEFQKEEMRDLDSNNVPEKYIELNGRKYFLEINGKNIEDSLKQ